MTHVLLVVENNSFPFDRRIAKEASSLREAGYSVSVICPAFGKDTLAYEKWQGIDVYRYRHYESKGGILGYVLEYSNAFIRILLKAIRVFSARPFKSIHVSNPPDFFWPMALFFKLYGVKFIYDQHDIAPEMYRVNEQKEKNAIYRFLLWNEKNTLTIADGIITTNESIRNRAKEICNIKNKPDVVVYNGPESDFRAIRDEAFLRKYTDKRVLLYLGEMARVDCVDVIIDVADQLLASHRYRDCKFVLLGDGPTRQNLIEMVQKKKLDAYFEFAGMVSKQLVMKYLGVSELCLCPDKPNGLNEYLTLVKCLEYMKAARPFVAFSLEETRYVSGDSALYAENLEEYVNHVRNLLDNPRMAQKLGESGLRRIESKFLWEQQSVKLLKIYNELM